MLHPFIHWLDQEQWISFLSCSCCGSIITDMFDACATFPAKRRRLNDHSPEVLLIPLDWTSVLTTHGGLCSEMAQEMAELEWKEFVQDNLGDFMLQMLLNTMDQDLLSEKKELLLKGLEGYE
jgi:hypothetical protein